MDILNVDWDAHNKEHERLLDELLQAKIDKDHNRRREIEARLDKLDDITWKAKSSSFSELIEFSSLFDALVYTSRNVGVPFPDLSYSKRYRFIFSELNNSRGILIFPRYDEGNYVVDLTVKRDDQVLHYGGTTTLLEDVVIVLSRWYMQNYSIELICKEFPWISNEPVKGTF